MEEERRTDYGKLIGEVATLKAEVTALKGSVTEWTRALKEYREVHIRCRFNPERNGEADQVVEAVKELREAAIADRNYRKGLLLGITGLGALQAWEILGPMGAKLLGGG